MKKVREGTDDAITRLTAELQQVKTELQKEIFRGREAQTKLSLIIDSIADGFYALDDQFRFIHINDPALRYFRKDRNEMLGRTLLEVFPAVRGTVFETNYIRAFETGEPQHFEAKSVATDRIVEMHAYPGPGNLTVLFRDVTEHKLAEEKASAAHRQLQAIIDNTPAIVYALDLEERFIMANSALAELLNATPEQMIGKRRHEFMPTQDADWHEENDRRVIEADRALEFEEYSQLQDRSITWLTTKFPLRDDQGKIYAVAGISTDTTERKKSEEALRLSEETFNKTFQAAAASMALSRIEDGRILDVNDRWLELMECSRDEVIGKTAAEHGGWKNLDDRAAMVRELQTHGFVRDREYTILSRRGREWTALISVQPVTIRGEQVLVTSAVDVTERKQMEERVRQSHQTFSELIERAPFGIYVVDSHFRVAHMNASSQEGAFRNVRPVIGRPFSEAMHTLWPEDVAEEIIGHFRHTLETGESYFSPRFVNPRQDVGIVESYEWELHRMMLPDGQLGVICYYYDSTKLREAETAIRKAHDELELRVEERTQALKRQTEALSTSEKEFRLLAEAMPQIVWITRADGWNIYFNQQWVNYTGLTLEESYGHGWNKPFHPDDQQRAWDAWQNAVTNNGTYSLECRLRAVDGTYRWWLVRGVPVVNEKGETTKWFGTCTDIEEFKRVEERLRHSQKMEALGTLTGGIAHDFNNILAAILGFAEMCLDDALPDTSMQKNLALIVKSSLRARDLIKQMLAYARKTEYEMKPLALAPLVKETTQLLRASIPTTIGIDFKTTATTDAVLANSTSMQQVIINLCTNAADAMREAGGTLAITLSDAEIGGDSYQEGLEPGPYIRLTVQDTGIGMSQEMMKRILDPFFTTKGVGKGTGMGLAVAYGIVKSFKGAISVESTPKRGSAFHVIFPKLETQEIREPSPLSQIPGGSEHILFVDDEGVIVELNRAVLERLGYTVTATTSSAEALKLFTANPEGFDVIITDQTMPHLTGLHLVEKAREIRPDAPVILCTGHSDSVNSETAEARGINAFLMKPFAKQELAESVRKVLDARVKR